MGISVLLLLLEMVGEREGDCWVVEGDYVGGFFGISGIFGIFGIFDLGLGMFL